MKRILMAIMAVAVAVTFSAPAFAGDTDKKTTESKGEKKEGHALVYAEEGSKKKEEKKKDGYVDTFGDEKKDEKKKDDKTK
jgi:Ni/Co efflux regulator RcnB